MANVPIDPSPLVPRGFVVCERSLEEVPPQRVFAFLGTSVRRINEEVAIAVLEPEVDPIDYRHVANAIYGFLQERAAPSTCVLQQLPDQHQKLQIEHQVEPSPQRNAFEHAYPEPEDGLRCDETLVYSDQEPQHGEDEGVTVLGGKPDGPPNRRRKKAPPLDTSLLRRSTRIEAIAKGYKSALPAPSTSATPTTPATSSKCKGKKNKGKPVMADSQALVLVPPLYKGHSVPGAPPAPHLSVTDEAIGVGFCKMQPEAVSRDKLLNSDDDSSA